MQALDDRLDAVDESGQGGGDWRREAFGVIEILAGHGHRKCARAGVVELAGQSHDGVGRELVRKSNVAGNPGDWFAVYVAGRAVGFDGGVDEDYGIDMADGFCQLWRQLMQAEDFDF